MNNKSNPLVNLLDQVKQGHQPPESNLWQEMGPQLEKMVRHVVRFGPGRSVVDQKIVREVAEVTGERDENSVVTRRLFQDMYGRLQPAGWHPLRNPNPPPEKAKFGWHAFGGPARLQHTDLSHPKSMRTGGDLVSAPGWHP